MSKLVVEVCQIDEIKTHPNADALDICIVRGWQCVSQKGLRRAGDKIVYVPTDSMMPIELSDRIGITKYLGGVTLADAPGLRCGRVRCAKLRGEPSFGVIMDCADPTWEIGRDVAEFYGITKYIPAMKLIAGDAEAPHPLLQKYTEIENLRNFPGILQDGEPVIVTEKLHGTNCKIGIVEGEWMASSMDVRRKRPDDDKLAGNIYWHPYTVPGVRRFCEEKSKQYKQVVIYGEVFGKVQTLNYGHAGRICFAAFDIMMDGQYLDWPEFYTACRSFDIPTVPLLASGNFCMEMVLKSSTGNSTMPGANHIREGVVVRPFTERTDPKIGRVVLKYINDDYLLKKDSGKISDSVEV